MGYSEALATEDEVELGVEEDVEGAEVEEAEKRQPFSQDGVDKRPLQPITEVKTMY